MTRDAWERSLNRRELLRGGAGAALALGLAGCGVGTGESGGGDAAAKKATEKVVKAEPDGDLVYFNWSEYLDPKLIKAFEKRHGVKVRQSNFDSMQGMMAKLRSGNRYDVIFPSSEWADRLRTANQLLRIDKGQIKNIDSVYDYFADPWYDPEADRTVPYAMYATGIIYRKDKVGELAGSWNDMGLEVAEGRAYLLDDYQEVIAAGNLVTGADLNDTDPAQVDKAKEWALGIKPKLRGFSTDDVQNMVNGNAWLHHGWNGDVVNIRNQVDKPENYSFQKCKEGIPLGTDCFAIPANAEHPGHRDGVHRLHARARERVEEHRVHGLPDALRGSRRDVREPRQGRPVDQRHRRGSGERPAVQEPRRRRPPGVGPGVDRDQGRLT